MSLVVMVGKSSLISLSSVYYVYWRGSDWLCVSTEATDSPAEASTETPERGTGQKETVGAGETEAQGEHSAIEEKDKLTTTLTHPPCDHAHLLTTPTQCCLTGDHYSSHLEYCP